MALLPEPGPAIDTAVTGSPAHMSALPLTLGSPLYRGATVALFLSGLGFSAAAPQIASFWSTTSAAR
jgi:MFS transporter, SET family, sugar efflux transporter